MPGDEFKKVRPGDPLKIPARTYNALLDVARGHKERGLMFAGGSVGQRLRSCTVVAYNYQIQNAPRGAVVQLRGRIITSAQVEFCRPTGSGEIYGIALEPIRLSHMGLIAISGGPWKIKTNVGTVGMRLAPVADSWVAAQGSGPWQCIEDVSGGFCRVVFSPGGAGGSYANPHTIGSQGEGDSSTVAWNRDAPPAGTSGLDLWVSTGPFYDHEGDQVFYCYKWKVSIDSLGHILAVSSKQKVTIDTPGEYT